MKINGYSCERRDRNSNGVALYIREHINYVLRRDLVPSSLEMIAIEISKIKVKPFIISTWYRPPDSLIGILGEFENFLKAVDPPPPPPSHLSNRAKQNLNLLQFRLHQ